MSIKIKLLIKEDIPFLVSAFTKANWHKPASTFESYLDEQKNNQRLVWIAWVNNHIAGYVTLVWHSKYLPFNMHNIPEIADLNVLPNYRKQGIGSNLLMHTEHAAKNKSEYVGIGVGLYADYGAAQQLYVRKGYIPDGKGVTYNYQPIQAGNTVQVDDNLILWFIKKLAKDKNEK